MKISISFYMMSLLQCLDTEEIFIMQSLMFNFLKSMLYTIVVFMSFECDCPLSTLQHLHNL